MFTSILEVPDQVLRPDPSIYWQRTKLSQD